MQENGCAVSHALSHWAFGKPLSRQRGMGKRKQNEQGQHERRQCCTELCVHIVFTECVHIASFQPCSHLGVSRCRRFFAQFD